VRIAFVCAAWRRYDVTRLVLAQRAHLCDELAVRGHEATAVIVADDENLDIARSFGFEVVEQSNAHLGRKFNDGLEFACRELEAEHVVLIGSDDWMHVDLFDRLPADEASSKWPTEDDPIVTWSPWPEALTGREIAIVDLGTGSLRRCRARGRYGVIPWIIPRKALEASDFRPIRDELTFGIDGSLVAGLGGRCEWIFSDPHDLCRVDFKSDVNLNSFEKVTSALGYGPVCLDPWSILARCYPEHLVEMARDVSTRMEVVA
jgi:hypothetical protein